MINAAGIPKPVLLAALYDRARPLGLGAAHFDPRPMEPTEAQLELLAVTQAERVFAGTGKVMPARAYFDYLRGRVMKIDVLADELDPDLYDRDNGEGAVAEVVAALREQYPVPA